MLQFKSRMGAKTVGHHSHELTPVPVSVGERISMLSGVAWRLAPSRARSHPRTADELQQQDSAHHCFLLQLEEDVFFRSPPCIRLFL